MRHFNRDFDPDPPIVDPPFEEALTDLMNRYSKEYESDTPDYMLADYVMQCLATFSTITNKRDRWHGKN